MVRQVRTRVKVVDAWGRKVNEGRSRLRLGMANGDEMRVIDRVGNLVAKIERDAQGMGSKCEEPWVLKRVGGRIDRFESQAAAREEARKSWPRCKLVN